jgi:DNA-binding beta-propeller fold protein YncE
MQRRAALAMTGSLLVLGVAGFASPSRVLDRQRGSTGPAYQVDPLWPKPLPNHWILGSVTGLAVDGQDHIWIVHRGADSMSARNENGLGTNPPTAEVCCMPAPPVLEFDMAGNLIGHWGGPGTGYDWPQTPGGLAVDSKGNVWIAAAGWPEPPAPRGGGAGRGRAGSPAPTPSAPPPPPRPFDAQVLKFSSAGQIVLQIGKPATTGEGNASRTALNRPAAVAIDEAANEIYVADGYGNRRVIVFDATTGQYKRHWGAYGAPPDDTAPPAYAAGAPAAKQFRAVTGVALSRDGMVYVCDRPSDRIQVFRKDGTFVKEGMVSKDTLGNGSAWSVAFSNDAAQRYLFVADGQNHHVTVLVRQTLEPAGTIGTGGRWPGYFYGVGSVGVDSHGNLYTGETFEGKRIQKFVQK